MNLKERHIMKKPPAAEALSAEMITVLSISPIEEDHDSLKRIVSGSESSPHPAFRWTVRGVCTLGSALSILKKVRFPIVVTERDLSPGTWKQVLAETVALPDPPLLIVTSRLGDERLWGEVLNLGGWDFLAKPFNGEEVLRVLNGAWLHWKHDTEVRESRTVPLENDGGTITLPLLLSCRRI